MATIREHEPAEGLRKENREISAKMKEDEQMQKGYRCREENGGD